MEIMHSFNLSMKWVRVGGAIMQQWGSILASVCRITSLNSLAMCVTTTFIFSCPYSFIQHQIPHFLSSIGFNNSWGICSPI